jgi:hypothetical protein
MIFRRLEKFFGHATDTRLKSQTTRPSHLHSQSVSGCAGVRCRSRPDRKNRDQALTIPHAKED